MPDTSLVFRPPAAADAERLSHLLAELGYPTPAEEVPIRLAELAAFPKALVLVAERQLEVVGLITMIIYPSIHAKRPSCLITSLVVSSDYRGKGIGSALLARAEQWALDNGAVRVSVGSGLHRPDTHQFYENRLYARSGIRFTKLLSEGSGTR